MHSLLKEVSRRDLVARARKLTPESRPLWGKFTVDRMLAHIVEACRMALGELPVKSKRLAIRHWPLNVLVVYLAPIPKGLPTARELIARPPETLNRELATFETYMDKFGRAGERREWPEHPALGKLSRRAWGRLSYRHFDHHLRQFGV
jgi:Protein of unknown function (DUF1569)